MNSEGPIDLSVKQKIDEPEDQKMTSTEILYPTSSVIDSSKKIMTSLYYNPLRLHCDYQSQKASSHLQKPVDMTLEGLRSTTTWPKPVFPRPLNLLSFPQPMSEFCNPSGPYLGGTALVSHPLLPIPLSRIPLSLSISKEPSYYEKSPKPFNSMEIHLNFSPMKPSSCSSLNSIGKAQHKEDSISPVSSTNGGELSPEFTRKDTPVMSSSSLRPVSVQAHRYECIDCKKSYATFSGLSRHKLFYCNMQTQKSFSCKNCKKVYMSLRALNIHILTHTLPCKCTICGKAFSRPSGLQGYIRTHTGEKPFACPHCSRVFADRSNRRAHLQTHSDIKKYSCRACSKTFSRMSLLLKHNNGGCLISQGKPASCILSTSITKMLVFI